MSGDQKFFFSRESAASVLIELMFSPSGPDFESAHDLRLLAHGSAFLYSLDDRLFLVTARHNFTGRHWTTGACLGEYPVSPTHITAAWLLKPPNGQTGWSMAIDQPQPGMPLSGSASIPMQMRAGKLVDKKLKPVWLEHPELGGDMDVAVLELGTLPDELFIVPWDSKTEKGSKDSWPLLAPGQDVMVLGYPDKLTSGPRFPLWTRGTIASQPGFGYEVDEKFLPLFLVDARTRRGQSGSAVMRHRAGPTLFIGSDGVPRQSLGAMSQLLGVYSGRTSDESDLGFVWPMEHVDVICRQGVPGTGTF